MTAVLGLAALLLTACAATGDAAPPEPVTAASGFPVTLKNTFGTTVVRAQPMRVATVGWGNQDVALALGVIPVGMPAVTSGDDNGDGILPWVDQRLRSLRGPTPALFPETGGIPFERVADTTPDVILAACSGLTQADYTMLSQIAPTVSYPEVAYGTTWRETALLDGAALGLRADAESLVADTERRITESLAAYPAIAGKSVAYAMIDPADTSGIRVYTPRDARVKFLGDLRLSTPKGIADLGGTSSYVTVSGGNAGVLATADILVTSGDEGTLAALQADPLLGRVPAIAKGAVVVVHANTPLAAAIAAPTVLSIPAVLDDYLSRFAAAAKAGGQR